jgi:hypothetical protein
MSRKEENMVALKEAMSEQNKTMEDIILGAFSTLCVEIPNPCRAAKRVASGIRKRKEVPEYVAKHCHVILQE